MLKRVTDSAAEIAVRHAEYPLPFPRELEFNAPVHGTWNIVHTGMLLPGAHNIYVCGINCMRGVVLTAAEMNCQDRFSSVILEEKDLLTGKVEDITIQGVADVIRKLPQRPTAVLLFTVCLHHFIGASQKRIFGELEELFPDIPFLRCYMDPIMQKHGKSPDMKLRKSIYDALQPRPLCAEAVSAFGADFRLDKSSDLVRLLDANGIRLRELPACGTFEDYLAMAESRLFVTTYPNGKYGGEVQAERLGRPFLYLPPSFSYDEIDGELQQLAEALGIAPCDTAAERAACDRALRETLELVGDTPIAIDYSAHPRPLGLARLLISRGFAVSTVYLDIISPEEEADFLWLKEHAPELRIGATMHVLRRVLPRGGQGKVLAIGQKAAWFRNTGHFVNIVQGAGLWGYDGIRRMAELMRDAFEHEKDTEDIVPRKGLGCESCI